MFCIISFLLFAFALPSLAQKKDNDVRKKPFLTNKYRLKKRGKPFEGVSSKGSEKQKEGKTVNSGFYRGTLRHSQTPRVMGQSQFRGTDPIFPQEKQTGSSTFKSNSKIEPHRNKTGSSAFTGKYKTRPHVYRRGYDKFISSQTYMPTTQKVGHDKFTGNYKYIPRKFKTGFSKFKSQTKYRPHVFKKGYDRFTGSIYRANYLDKRKKIIAYNTQKQQKYKGNVRFIDWRKSRAKRSHRMATSLGALKIKYYPRKSKVSNRRMQKYFKKPYDARRLRTGKFMWKKNMPRFQRYKSGKLKYSSKRQLGTQHNEMYLHAQPRVSPKFIKDSKKAKTKEKEALQEQELKQD